MCDYLSTLRDRPVWQAMPEEVKHNLIQPLPVEGQGPESAYQEFLQNVLPYPNGNIHPRFWGWVQGTGTPLAMLAEMLAAAMNPHMAGFNQAPILVEKQIIAWMAELMGMPKGTRYTYQWRDDGQQHRPDRRISLVAANVSYR
jgi:aromatic-L-amino-acid/L-tryptophan decarboxylase